MFKSLAFALVLVLASAEAFAAPCPAGLPVLFIVQDKSGSMANPPDPTCTTCPSKWDSSQVAVSSLTSKFGNRFRFGVEMYPQASTTFNCTTGTTVMPVPSTSWDIGAAFDAVAPGGGTPTAVSLSAAKSYLLGLHLPANEPAYVLLLTDGLPNCNLALNPATCTATTPGCANDACSLGAKDCLDDAGSRAAAAALKAAGIKVYVVGFGNLATANNDKVVLDGIAASGGTGHAYTANDEASLTAALDAVAFDATTCCKDACASGAARCTSSGKLERCQLDSTIGCTNWTLTSCPAQSTCRNGACETCSNQCTAGATRCLGSSAQKCVTGPSGCTVWQETEDCGWGELCTGGACTTCKGCNSGESRCLSSGDLETCELDLWTGCTEWSRSSCGAGATCAGTSCQSCTGTCTAGSKRCVGATPETCAADARGCTSWKAGSPCTDFCSGGACGSCGTTCNLGEKRCNGSGMESCTRDANGCTVWSPAGGCVSGEFCVSGNCQSCTTNCSLGVRRCSGNGVQECRAAANGCTDFVALSTCKAGETCTNGVCVPPCKDECAESLGKCDGEGRPLECKKAPSGCTVWKAATACTTGQVCVTGACHDRCSGGEIETCPEGYVCTGLPEGRVCLPKDPSTEKPPLELPEDPGDTTEPPPSQGPGDDAAVAASGCGCSPAAGAAGAWLPLAGLLALGLRRRR